MAGKEGIPPLDSSRRRKRSGGRFGFLNCGSRIHMFCPPWGLFIGLCYLPSRSTSRRLENDGDFVLSSFGSITGRDIGKFLEVHDSRVGNRRWGYFFTCQGAHRIFRRSSCNFDFRHGRERRMLRLVLGGCHGSRNLLWRGREVR